MKRLYFIFILLFSIPIVNASTINYSTTYERDNSNLNTILEYNNTYILVENNTILKYNEDKLFASKTLEDITNISIIPLENNYLVVGKSNTFLKIYLLNEYLQIMNSKETSISSNNTDLYNYNNKIYILLNTNYILDSINLYEVDTSLEITEKKLSSYGADVLKEILKSDYTAIKQEDISKTILDTAYNIDNNVLLYKKDTEYYLSINDKDILVPESKEILILNNKILLLTKNSIATYSMDGILEDTINLDEEYNHIIKTSKNILLINDTKINVYTYTVNIQVLESSFGTLEIPNTAEPNTKITYTAIPNSGYELEGLIITDEYGNTYKTASSSFQVPSSDTKVLAVYKEKVNNPETVDKIVLFIVAILTASVVVIYNYKKLKWINN